MSEEMTEEFELIEVEYSGPIRLEETGHYDRHGMTSRIKELEVVALHESHPAHPGGEVLLMSGQAPIKVARTLKVQRKLERGELRRVQDGSAAIRLRELQQGL